MKTVNCISVCVMSLIMSLSMVACGSNDGEDENQVINGDSTHDSALVGTWDFYSGVYSSDPVYNRDSFDYTRTIVFNADGTGINTRIERGSKSVEKSYWKTRKGVIGILYEEDFESWDDEFEEDN